MVESIEPGEPEASVEVARRETEHGELVLRERRPADGPTSLELRANGVFVMDTLEVASERALASAALDAVADPRAVAVAGLGLGFTMHEVLADSRVERCAVVEIEQALVDWMRDGTVPHGPALLADERVSVVVADIAVAVAEARPESYDLLLLDVDNGPDHLVHQANAALYRGPFLTARARAAAAGRRGGGVVVGAVARARRDPARRVRPGRGARARRPAPRTGRDVLAVRGPQGVADVTGGSYVALGSSMAAGPGIPPRAPDSPRLAMRSARNYPHLVADELGLDLVDVTYSGATTAHVLREEQNGAPPQVTALRGDEELVTITIGGNDVWYVPGLYAASLPRPLRLVPVVGRGLRSAVDREQRDRSLVEVAASLREVGTTVRAACPEARVLFVDYLTLLPPAGTRAFPLRAGDVDVFRHVAQQLERITAEAAAETGCELVRAAAASREHHAWSRDPWTVAATLPLPGRPLAYHPNAWGMRQVADLVVAHMAQENSSR